MENFGLVRIGEGKAAVKQIRVPHLRDDYILVRTVTIGLNPTDWTTLDAPGKNGSLVGCDYSGVVEKVGKNVTKSFKIGDRVAGFGHGGNDANHENGAFAKYIAVKAALQMHIPDGVSFEAAATVGVGIGTTGYALYKVLNMPIPGNYEAQDKKPILIYGGSTATGSIAIQFAKMSGREVLTTCSPKHFQILKDRGASQVFDYRAPDVGKQILAATNNDLFDVLDTVATESSSIICATGIGKKGGIYCNLLDAHCPREDVRSIFFLGYDLSGESYIFEGESYDANLYALEFGTQWYKVAEKLWSEGKWTPHPHRVGRGGLLGAINGMEEMRQGKVSGEKLVYLIDDTQQ